MDEESQWPLLTGCGFFFSPVVGFDHIGVYDFVIPAFKGELFRLAHEAGSQFVAVQVGDLFQIFAVRLDREQFGGRFQALHAKQDAALK